MPSPQLQCATLDVPLDYRNPSGATIEVAVSRLASPNPAKRRGVLLMNPGGPGGEGLDLPVAFAILAEPEVAESYDLIGFDPRGMQYSTPVTCQFPPELQTTNVPPYARDAADVRRRAVEVAGIARLCGDSPTAAILPHISTANTARDMDRIRAALGEPTISYWGLSYGTYLGAVYATLFPHRTDRIVLDSAVGPEGFDVTASRRLALGFQIRFPDFAAWAAQRDATYGLGATPAAITAKYFELATRLDREPFQGADGALFRTFTFSRLYDDRTFPELAEVWQAVDAAGPLPGRALAAQDIENVLASQLHVICNDTEWPESVRTYQHSVAVDRIRFPMFGAAAANIWPCAFWPIDPVERPVRIDDRGPANILIMENLRDPATPLPGAVELRLAFGHRARLVTVDQGGHGVYLLSASACGNDMVSEFLLTGRRPARDTFCPRETGATATRDVRPLAALLRPLGQR
ncbi:MAG TPA: alpha/beta hydrolase [Actinophytocola sp.]|uniref:alpha/beta hydrolase n=1 Tax=Actinophytocola sp. TaxID=1872138 RepID=UPI002DBA10C4|nr:alpha/beta hydrolase [Actinophytocola sp.]HEU5470265.1 alpha/beta hydrolase [Actinophytocola sp.]